MSKKGITGYKEEALFSLVDDVTSSRVTVLVELLLKSNEHEQVGKSLYPNTAFAKFLQPLFQIL